MAKRYYLCPVIEVNDPDLGRLVKPDLPAGTTFAAAGIPIDPVTGDPLSSWTLVIVAAPDHRALLQDVKLDALPEFPLDAKINAMQAAARVALQAALTRRGIAVDVQSADGFRDLVRQIGRKVDTNFHENALDVSE